MTSTQIKDCSHSDNTALSPWPRQVHDIIAVMQLYQPQFYTETMPKPELCELNTLQSIFADAFKKLLRIDNSIDSHFTVGTAVTHIPIHMSMTRRGELVKQIKLTWLQARTFEQRYSANLRLYGYQQDHLQLKTAIDYQSLHLSTDLNQELKFPQDNQTSCPRTVFLK